jgi:hypothetical protein
MSHRVVLNITLLISAMLFVLSLTNDCYCTTSVCMNSVEVFGTGWFGAGVELGTLGIWITEQLSKRPTALDNHIGAAVMWLANPLLFISWIGILRWLRGSLVISICAMIFALSFLLFDHILHNDIGHYGKIAELKIGYWLWVSSTVVMVVGNLVLKLFPIKHVLIETSSSPFIPE